MPLDNYPAPYRALLSFEQEELHSVLADIRAGRAAGAISTLQAVADRSGAAEVFGRACFDPRSRGNEAVAGLDGAWRDVFEFHTAFDHPRSDKPVIQPAERVEARANWLDEEVGELRDAVNVIGQADAYLDIIYFALGGLVEIGVKPQSLFNIVHAANMAKLQPDGSVARRDDGKIIKPDGWVAPEPKLAAEIERQAA